MEIKGRIQSLSGFYRKSTFADATLVSEGRKFRVHKLVLSVASDYFLKMFTSKFKEGQHEPEVNCDVSADVLETLLPWFYGDSVMLRKDQLLPSLEFATMALIVDLKKTLERLLEGSCETDDYPHTLSALLALDDSDLIFSKISGKLFIELDRKKDLSGFKSFLELPRQMIELYFTRYHGKIESEDKVLKAIIFWWLHDREERSKVLGRLLEDCLRTDEVSKEQATELRKHLRANKVENPDLFAFLSELPRPSKRLPQLRYEAGPQCNAVLLYIKASNGAHIQQYIQLGQEKCHSQIRQQVYPNGAHVYPATSMLIDLGDRYMVAQLHSQTSFCMEGSVGDSTKFSARRVNPDGDVIPVSGAFSKKDLAVAVRSTKGLQFYLMSKFGPRLVGTTKHPAAMNTEKPVHFAAYCNKLIMLVFGQKNESVAIVWDQNLKKKPKTYQVVLPRIGKKFEACQRNQFLVLLSSGKFHLIDLEEMLSSKQKTVEPKTFSSPETDAQQLDSTSNSIGTKICVYGPYLLALSILPSRKLSIRVCKLNDVIGQSKVTSHAWRKCGITIRIDSQIQSVDDITDLTFHGFVADGNCLSPSSHANK